MVAKRTPERTPARRQVGRATRVSAVLVWTLLTSSIGSASLPSTAIARSEAGPATGANNAEEGDHPPDSEAQRLFEAGREAMARGNYELACQRFTESQRLEQAVGTLLNLANCEERRNRLASALRKYVQALSMLDTNDPRRAFARKQAGSLTLRMPKLTVTLAARAPRDVQVTCNGKRLTDELDVAMGIDPGPVVVVTEAKGYHPRLYQLQLVPGERKQLTVTVGARLAAPNSVTDAPPPPPEKKSSTAGYIFLATGLTSGAAAGTFGVLTYSQYRTARAHCDVARGVCFDSEGLRAAKLGTTYESLAYAFGGAGVLSSAIGSYLLLSSGEPEEDPRGPTVSLSATVGAPQLRVSGTF